MHPSVLTLSSEINFFYQRTRPFPEHVAEQDTLIAYIGDCVDYLHHVCSEESQKNHAFLKNMRNQTTKAGWNTFTFGSTSYGASGLHSDIDLAIKLNFRNNRFDKIYILNQLSQLISQNDEYGLLRVQLLLSAKYPIIRLYHLQYNQIKIDISIADRYCFKRNNFISDLINHYHQRYNLPCKKLIVFIKYWSKQRAINNSYKRYLNSFGFTLLIIKFIQYLLQNNKHIIYFQKSIAHLVFEWFEFYCFKFDLCKYAVDIMDPNRIFHAKKSPVDALEVMDPVNCANNVAHTVGSIQLEHMKSEFMRAFHILGEWMMDKELNISLFDTLTQRPDVVEMDTQSNMSSISNSSLVSDSNTNNEETAPTLDAVHKKKNDDGHKEAIKEIFG